MKYYYILDPETGIRYNLYGEDGIIDPDTSTVYVRLNEGADDYPEAISIAGSWYLPNRRHRIPPDFRAEIEAAGFRVLYQDCGYGGNLICTHEIAQKDTSEATNAP